jgi:hypothetical protein
MTSFVARRSIGASHMATVSIPGTATTPAVQLITWTACCDVNGRWLDCEVIAHVSGRRRRRFLVVDHQVARLWVMACVIGGYAPGLWALRGRGMALSSIAARMPPAR